MQVWSTVPLNSSAFQGGVVSIGNFDGLHLGHQALLGQAQALPGPRTVLTFDPHPVQVLFPERQLKRLFPREDLIERLPDYGVDLLVVLKFTKEFAALSAREFLESYVRPLAPRHIVAGYDFGFGHDREGSLAFLSSWAESEGIEVHVVEAKLEGGEVVGSRRLRRLLSEGRVAEMPGLLGRRFYLRGEVVSGAGRGAGIGVPTMNLKVENEMVPMIGVYATRTIGDGRSYPSVTNVGVNPTFESDNRVRVETHVLDETLNWRGRKIDVEFVARLRDEKKFANVEDLKKQIQADILEARHVLK